MTNPTPYRFEGGLESLDPGASFSYGVAFPRAIGPVRGQRILRRRRRRRRRGPGDVPYARHLAGRRSDQLRHHDHRAEPPDDLPTPPDPSLVVTVQTECVDDGASYLATFAITNPSPYTFYGLWVIPPGGTAYNVQGFIGAVHRDGQRLLRPRRQWHDDPTGVRSPRRPWPVDVPDDCTTETTPPDPDDPSLQVTIATRCADPGTDRPTFSTSR